MSKIEIKNLTFGYDSQGTLLFEQANLNFDTQWKLGLIGRNGRGKTTLLNILQNKLPYQGQVIHQQEFVYFPQQTKDKERLTYYVLNDITDFEIWEIERELQLMVTNCKRKLWCWTQTFEYIRRDIVMCQCFGCFHCKFW